MKRSFQVHRVLRQEIITRIETHLQSNTNDALQMYVLGNTGTSQDPKFVLPFVKDILRDLMKGAFVEEALLRQTATAFLLASTPKNFFGRKVKTSVQYKRVKRYTEGSRINALWDAQNISPVDGIFLGTRNLRDGVTDWYQDEVPSFKPSISFAAALVQPSHKTNAIYCPLDAIEVDLTELDLR